MNPREQQLQRLLAAVRRAGPAPRPAPAAGWTDRIVARWTVVPPEPPVLGLWEALSRRAACGLAIVALGAALASWDLLPGEAAEPESPFTQELLEMLP